MEDKSIVFLLKVLIILFLMTFFAFGMALGASKTNEDAAYRAATEAIYLETGLSNFADRMKDRYVGKELQYFLGDVIFAMRVLTEQKIIYKKDF